MRIPVVELSECIRCGVCQDVCPEVFRITDAGYVEVIHHVRYPEQKVDDAIKHCPTRCISWEEG